MFRFSSLFSSLILVCLVSSIVGERIPARHRRVGETNVGYWPSADKCPAGSFGEKKPVSFKEDCNTCWCIDVGKYACTAMGCASSSFMVSVDEPKEPEADPRCVNGTETPSWKQECNTCFCVSEPAYVVCTRMLCPSFPLP